MKYLIVLAFALARVVVGALPPGCHANNCYRAVAGTGRGHTTTAAQADCTSFELGIATVIPSTAISQCSSDSKAYLSACSCFAGLAVTVSR